MSTHDLAERSPPFRETVFEAGTTVSVAALQLTPQPYDYCVPVGLELTTGSIVEAPLGSKRVYGVVLGPGIGTLQKTHLKELHGKADCPALPAAVLEFANWASSYVMAPLPKLIKMIVCVPKALASPPPQMAYRLSAQANERYPSLRPSAQRQRILENLRTAGASGLDRPSLLTAAKCGGSVLKGLVQAGLVEAFEAPQIKDRRQIAPAESQTYARPPKLSQDQRHAAEDLINCLKDSSRRPICLEGVTGSGKTEVYMEAISNCLKAGQQTLVLVPEIALTPQMLSRFRDRFGIEPAPWHSRLTPARRANIWRNITLGQHQIIIGARSALFLPYAQLGLIVVDEEHDSAYKQEEGLIYHARDLAVARGKFEKCGVILASATPSLETLANVQSKKYRHTILKSRFRATMPDVQLLDLRAAPPETGAFLSPELLHEVEKAANAGEQALLFLNRRGFAPLTLCHSCGHRYGCTICAAWLVAHQRTGKLHCHHCGAATHPPTTCPNCDAADSLVACGPGVERIAAEVAERLPRLRTALASSDTLSDPNQASALAAQMRNGEIDLIIGTQIIAKGHHFPKLTCVGVVDGDLGLTGADPRAAERTRALLHQVAGRAGRAERPGRVLIQTRNPEHPVMQALISEDQDAWVQAELIQREQAMLPPFVRLAAINLSSIDYDAGEEAGRLLQQAAPHIETVRILGPAPALIPLLRGRHRWRFLVLTPRTVRPQAVIQQWFEAATIPKSVRVQIDIDPLSVL